jgi:hypothetical protein
VSTTYAVNGRPTTVDDFASTLVAVQNTGAVPLLIEPLGRTVDVGATVTVPGWSTRRTRVRTAGQNGTAVVTLTAGSPAAAPGPGGVTFDPGPASTMSLTVAGGTWYSNEGLTTAVSFPVSITAATVLYPAAAGSITITAVVGGTTQLRGMNVNEGSAEGVLVWTPLDGRRTRGRRSLRRHHPYPVFNSGTSGTYDSSVVYRDTLYLGSHPYASIYSFDGAAVRYEGAATGMQSLRDLTVFDDRIIISGRASGTPTTGGAAFTIGDSNRRPSRTNELPRAVAVPSPVPGIFLGTFDPRAITSPLSVASANRAYFNKVRPVAAKFITQLSTSIAVSSGNLDLGIFAADGTNGAPGTMLASTGSTGTYRRVTCAQCVPVGDSKS